jgi:dipeptidyl aminopeptidase/acylaminoacyl peptidase
MADLITKPLLLVHGDADNNPGTHTMQSERMYAALKGHGCPTRLVLLPHESHGYGAGSGGGWVGAHAVEGGGLVDG